MNTPPDKCAGCGTSMPGGPCTCVECGMCLCGECHTRRDSHRVAIITATRSLRRWNGALRFTYGVVFGCILLGGLCTFNSDHRVAVTFGLPLFFAGLFTATVDVLVSSVLEKEDPDERD